MPADQSLISQIRSRLEHQDSEELQRIWVTHDRSEWSDEAFEAISQILLARNTSPAAQKSSPQATITFDPPELRPAIGDSQRAQAVWQVKFPDNSIRTYSEEEAVINAIMARQIEPGLQCRGATRLADGSIKTQSKWKSVERSFGIFRPIRGYMIKGGLIGLLTGTWLLLLFRAFDAAISAILLRSPKMAGFAFVTCFWLRSLTFALDLPPHLKKTASIIVDCICVGIFLELMGIAGGFLGFGGPAGILSGALAGLSPLGALIVGGLFGGLSGLIIGTCTGLARRRVLPIPPGAREERVSQILGLGIVLPVACLGAGIFLFEKYWIPFSIETTVKFLQ